MHAPGVCAEETGAGFTFPSGTHVGAALGWSSVELSQPAFLLQLQSPSTCIVDTSTLEMNKLDVGLPKPHRQRSGFCEAICHLGRALQETPDKSAPLLAALWVCSPPPQTTNTCKVARNLCSDLQLPACKQARA